MPLTSEQLFLALDTLFDPTLDVSDADQLASAGIAFQNLAMHFVDVHAHHLLDKIRFDNIRLGLMLKRFHRDAYGVGRFSEMMQSLVTSGLMTQNAQIELERGLSRLSIRINSAAPRKTRVAAAFSLWMATFRPIHLAIAPSVQDDRNWRLDATINFWIATRFLSRYGAIQIGDPVRDVHDFRTRLHRIWYDFTIRDLNLSSLEFMYAFVFHPTSRPAPPAKVCPA